MFTDMITLIGNLKDDYLFKDGVLYVLRAVPKEEIERMEVDPPEEVITDMINIQREENKKMLDKIKKEGVDEVNIDKEYDSLKVKKIVFTNMFDCQIFEDEFELKYKRKRIYKEIISIIEDIYNVFLVYNSVKKEVEKELNNFDVKFEVDPIIKIPILTKNIVNNINNFDNIIITETKDHFLILPEFFSLTFNKVLNELQKALDDINE